jgi:hypothetical protein
MSSTGKNDIKFGNKDLLSEGEFDCSPRHIRISLMVDMQVYRAFKDKADKEGEKYQVLMRRALRDSNFNLRMNNVEGKKN